MLKHPLGSLQEKRLSLCKKHVPEQVLENDHVKIYWDFPFQLYLRISHYRRDIVIFIKKDKDCTIVDVAVLGDQRINEKEAENITNVGDLKLKLLNSQECGTEKQL